MKRLGKWLAILVLLAIVGIAGLFGHGYWSAVRESTALAQRADQLIAEGQSAAALGPRRVNQLLLVEDPTFRTNNGIDLRTPGAGLTTLTQGLSKKVGFAHFKPGWRKFRLMGFASGLNSRLSKDQILALYLHHVGMGRDRTGQWMEGFFTASRRIFGKPPAALTERQFLTLVAVVIAPSRLRLAEPTPELNERVDRIERLVHGRCRLRDLRDVALAGCTSAG